MCKLIKFLKDEDNLSNFVIAILFYGAIISWILDGKFETFLLIFFISIVPVITILSLLERICRKYGTL
jgi:hypothetical protein